MTDMSHLDSKYFLDWQTYNCPFCNRRNVAFSMKDYFAFHWSHKKFCYGYIVECSSCEGRSMHLSFTDLLDRSAGRREFEANNDLDSEMFYSVPTSFFVLDDRIPKAIRELVTEAEGCLKMNFLTGASACARKAVYELTIIENAAGDSYEDRIKSLKAMHPDADPLLFDILGHIQDMTSDKVHEQSWDKWDSRNLQLILATLKEVLREIYVVPAVRKERSDAIQRLLGNVREHAKTTKRPGAPKALTDGSSATPALPNPASS